MSDVRRFTRVFAENREGEGKKKYREREPFH